MTDELRFEVRPIEGAFAAVGETVAFRREGGRLYALNEDGEAFGVVPSKFAAAICGQPAETLTAEVAGRGEGGFLTVQVAFEEAGGELANEPSATPADQAAPALAEAPAPGPAAPAVPAAGEATEQVPVAEAASEASPAAKPATVEETRAPQSKKKLPVWAKVALGALAAVVVLALVIAAVASSGTEATQTVTVGHVEYEVPGSWTIEDLSDETDELFEYLVAADPDDFNGVVTISADWPSYYFSEDLLPAILVGVGVEGDPVDEYTTDEGALVYLYEGVELEGDSTDATGYVQIVISGDYATVTSAACLSEEFDEHADELLEILNTLTIIDAEEPSYSQVQEEESSSASQIGHVVYEIPESWTVEDLSDDNSDFEYYYAFYANDFDGGLLVLADGSSLLFAEALMSYTLSGMGIEDDPVDEYLTDDGAHVYLYEYDMESSGDTYSGYMQIVVSGDYAAATYANCTSDELDYHAEELKEILYSVTVIEDDEDEAA